MQLRACGVDRNAARNPVNSARTRVCKRTLADIGDDNTHYLDGLQVQTPLQAAQYNEVVLARYQETELRRSHLQLNRVIAD